MPNDFEALISELREAGLDDDYIDRLERATAASPIRKERDQFKAQAESALAEAKRYQQVVAGQRFKEFGIKVRPDALRTPDDLDWADESKVKEWAAGAGLIEAPDPRVTTPEVEAHGRVGDAASGADKPPVYNSTEDINTRIAAANSPEEVMAIVQAAGIPTPQQ